MAGRPREAKQALEQGHPVIDYRAAGPIALSGRSLDLLGLEVLG